MLHRLIERAVQQAVAKILPDADTSGVLVRPCPDPKFGDYQTNALMALAKARKMNSRQLAADVLQQLDVSEWCEKVEIAGAGFLNFRLKTSALEQTLAAAARGEHLFFEKAVAPRTIVIDFSSPNVAKPMHVGHIRSTVLGDCLARTLRLLGHRVTTDNHIGDWGTQFGLLLVGWKRDLNPAALDSDALGELERIYKHGNAEIKQQKGDWLRTNHPQRLAEELEKARAKQTPEHEVYDFILKTLPTAEAQRASATAAAARQELVKLQSGDAENIGIWRRMIDLSQHQFDAIYERLGVKFDFTLGESFYNPRLKQVVAELCKRGIARESEGAICVFSDGALPPKEDPFLKQQDGEWKPNPCLIQKSDGAANYATTDLATLTYRLETWQPAEIVYVTDGRQQLHFRQLFAIFRRWYPTTQVKLSHVWFGSILGEDNTPFKTRSGETVKLAELLDEAEKRAFILVSEKNPELGEPERREIARVVGLGAIKYADLSPNRQSDYVFSWEKMLSFTGNTAPYLQYAYARIRSIFRKAGVEANVPREIHLAAPEEITLAKKLMNFGLVLEAVTDDYRPNFLCNFLYELAGDFTSFYEACPVLKASDAERASRLALCDLTGRVLQQGLNLLGIETVEQM